MTSGWTIVTRGGQCSVFNIHCSDYKFPGAKIFYSILGESLKKNKDFATKSNFFISISLEPNVVDIRYLK